ncbi:MAG: hypothetical protein JNG86_20695 [Verrucomicrobiaceae bacterium]|nr:hypothetical protein [Verrucomicrobiaceae bacterium]
MGPDSGIRCFQTITQQAFMNWRTAIIISCLIVHAQAQDDGRTPQQRLEWERRGRLERGDITVVDEYHRENNLRKVWSIFGNAYWNSYGHGRTTQEREELKMTEEQRVALNQPIRERARAILESIPGHAKSLGDEIDRLGNITGSQDVVERAQNNRGELFSLLASLGSPESIQQIGRFMLDDRRPLPEGWKPPPVVVYSPPWTPASLSDMAMEIDRALGDASPLKRLKDLPSIGRFGIQKKYMQDWWRSEESAKYRVPLPGVEPPPDPPPLEGPLVRPAYTPVPSSSPPAAPPAMEEESGVLWKEMLVLGSTLLAVLLLVTWLAAHKRVKKVAAPSSPKVFHEQG